MMRRRLGGVAYGAASFALLVLACVALNGVTGIVFDPCEPLSNAKKVNGAVYVTVAFFLHVPGLPGCGPALRSCHEANLAVRSVFGCLPAHSLRGLPFPGQGDNFTIGLMLVVGVNATKLNERIKTETTGLCSAKLQAELVG